jgi:hypothetical protein
MKVLLTTAAIFWAIVAVAQIQVPAESEPYQPIVAKVVAPMPEGSQFSGGWTVDAATKYIPAKDGEIHIWAAPGEHKLKFIGYWVQTKTVSFKDGDGNIVEIESYLGSGFINEEAGFKVLGDTPPGPDPDLPPVGKSQLVIFLVADQIDKLPNPQRELATSLKVRKDLRDLGHNFVQVIDDSEIKDGVPAKWTPWIKAVMGKALPQVALAPIGGGPIVTYPLPADYAGLLKLLGETE